MKSSEFSRRNIVSGLVALGASLSLPKESSANQTKMEEILTMAREMKISITEDILLSMFKNQNPQMKPLIINVRHDEDYDPKDSSSIVLRQSDSVLNIINEVDPVQNISKISAPDNEDYVSFNPEINFRLNRPNSSLLTKTEVQEMIKKRLGAQQDRPIVVVCQAGVRSSYAALALNKFYGVKAFTLDNGLTTLKNPELISVLRKY